VVDETPFLDRRTRKALGELDKDEKLQVADLKESGRKRRKGAYPEDCVVTFES